MVAVVVTCDPGWWLEPCLRALVAQDYPQLAVLVIDAGSEDDPTPRVAAVAPKAYVRRARRRRGFAAAANEVLEAVEGASHYMFCHDDVVPAPNAVRLLVEEALRSNAGIVAPKLVDWWAPDRMLSAGMGVDGYAVSVPLVERGELDQQQHDVVRDVFYAPSACLLVRADLFATLGGFDVGYGLVGEDLDLGWRGHLAGARVVFAPGARVRHVEATENGRRALDGSLRAGAGESASDVASVDESARHPAAPEPPPEGEGDWWDLRRWDEEDAEGVGADAGASAPGGAGSAEGAGSSDGAGSAGGPGGAVAHRGGRRRRHKGAVAEDPADDEEWEPAWTGRRRGHREVGAGAAGRAGAAGDVGEGAPRGVTAGGTPTPARPRGPDAAALDQLRAESRLRVLASDYGAIRAVLRLVPLLVFAVVDACVTVVRRGRVAAWRALRPWGILVRDARAIARRRAATRRIRAVSDRAVTVLQARGVTRLRAAFRSSPDAAPERDAPLTWRRGRQIGPAGAWLALAVVAYGSRRLFAAHLPTIGELGAWPSLGALRGAALSGWRTTGLGVSGPAPAAFGLFALAGVLVAGHTTLLQHILVLGMLPIGAIGAIRLARPLGSRRARVVAMVAYLAIPLPYNALADGRWSGLVAYAALPWLLGLLARATGLAPFDESGATGDEDGSRRPVRQPLSAGRRVVATALLLAAAGAVEPALLPLAILVAVALGVGSALTGRLRAGWRAVVLAGAGAAGAVVLLAPWSIGWMPPVGEWAAFSGPAAGGRAAHLSTLLRFQTGPLGAGPLGYALLVAAAFPLLVGRGWRHDWAVRMWVVALGSWALAWAAQHAALGVGWPPADVLLVPAAIAIAVCVGLGVAAFELDLSGYHFGWRQAASVVAAAAACAACLPVLVRSVDGGWRQPTTGFDGVLPWLAAKRADGDFRVLWIGAPGVLPLASWRLDAHTAYATSVDGVPDLTDQWPGTSRGPTRLLAQAITLARRGLTTDVGHLLAPMGVRYIVVVEAASPLSPTPDQVQPIAADLTVGLTSQLDLETVDRATALTVYQNDAWAPLRVQLPDGAVAAAQLNDPRAARAVDLSAGLAVLPHGSGATGATGVLPTGAVVEVAAAPSNHWRLSVAGKSAARRAGFGSANLFTVGAGGPASLHYGTPIGWRLADVAEAGLWVVALLVVVRGRRREAEVADAESAPPPATPILVGAAT